MSHFSFLCRTKTSFGKNALEHLPFDLSAMGCTKPMVIHDTGTTRPLIRAFKGSGMTLGTSPPLPEKDQDETTRFIRSMYEVYTQKGYDALVALGGEPAADMAKALNIAVSLGPEALKQGRVTDPLRPLVYLPTGVKTGTAATGSARFNGRTFVCAFLAPDQALMDPDLLVPDDRSVLLDSALTSLATGCEIFALSQNFPARAYAAAVIQLALPPLRAIMLSGLDPEENLAKQRKLEQKWQTNLVQASVLTGYLKSADPVGPVMGQKFAAKSRISPGHAMVMILPSILESGASPGLADLLLPLTGPDDFSSVPGPQQGSAAVHAIRTLVNDLHRITGGRLPRTLGEAGWNETALTAIGREIRNEKLSNMDPKFIDKVLTHAGSGYSGARP